MPSESSESNSDTVELEREPSKISLPPTNQFRISKEVFRKSDWSYYTRQRANRRRRRGRRRLIDSQPLFGFPWAAKKYKTRRAADVSLLPKKFSWFLSLPAADDFWELDSLGDDWFVLKTARDDYRVKFSVYKIHCLRFENPRILRVGLMLHFISRKLRQVAFSHILTVNIMTL